MWSARCDRYCPADEVCAADGSDSTCVRVASLQPPRSAIPNLSLGGLFDGDDDDNDEEDDDFEQAPKKQKK